MTQIFKNKLPRVKNPWSAPIISFGFGLQSERSRKYVSSSLHPRIDNPQFSRSENKSSGQTLIEVIIAIAVGTLIITAILALATRSNRNSNLARASTQASKLAEGGLEIIKNIQDVNNNDVVNVHSSLTDVNWIDLYSVEVESGPVCGVSCVTGEGHVYIIHEDGESDCTSGTGDWCLHGNHLITDREFIDLDEQRFTRVVYVRDSFPGESSCNTELNDFRRIKQFRVVVAWADPVGEHEQEVVTCIRR